MLPAITWLPSPNRNLRDPRHPILGVVSHRIVGTLSSARDRFLNPNGGASSHFGIGTIDGVLTIHQYVDLADMAWTNGDVRDPTWAFYQPGINPNLTTVTIEHEDGGYANRGVVSEAVWLVSMELQKLITSGNPAAIRAAGIRMRYDYIAAQLAAVPKDERGFIDHHQIAGPNKPYCFRRWLDDPGFVEGSPSRRDRLLAHLLRDDMPRLNYVPRIMVARYADTELREDASLDAPVVAKIPSGTITVSVGETYDQQQTFNLVIAGDPERLLFARRSQLRDQGTQPDPELYRGIAAVVNARIAGQPIGTYTEADLQLARQSTADKAEAQTQAWIGTRPPIKP